MPVKATHQRKREFCIALFNRDLHKNNQCPGNYSVEYDNGWFYWSHGIDEQNRAQDPELTAEAERIMKAGSHIVLYSEVWNTYVLGENHENSVGDSGDD